ncbi:hypothetical protein BDZ45DRAFT_809990 [Acephala macrosclerotiorum]|nr:hypothetical protein BDZ45DRAFT_809990 [Acephala macrosclerotiorum]
MSNFHDYASYEQDWKHQSWKMNVHGRINPPFPTAPFITSLLLQSTSTEMAVAAGATKDASSDQASCLQNCRDTFRDSILPHDGDFDKICAVLANENDNAVFDSLYICDERCGVMVNSDGGAGQDPNVNFVVTQCQSFGFPGVVDPGPPQTNSASTPSPLVDEATSIGHLPSQTSSTNSPENGQSTASIIATTTASTWNYPPLPNPLTSTSRGPLGKTSLPVSTASSTSTHNMYLTSTTILTSTLPTVIYSPVISSIPTSIISDPGALSISSPSPSSTPASSRLASNTSSSSTSAPTTHAKMNPNNTAGIILAIMGIVLLLSATIVVLFLRRKQRQYIRSLIAKVRNKDKDKDHERCLGGIRESDNTDRCACCYDLPSPPTPPSPKTPRRYSRSTSSVGTPDTCILNLAYPPEPKYPIKERNQTGTGRGSPTYEEQSPPSPITVHVGGVTKRLYHTRANTSLPTDAQGIRWPEAVTLKGEAKEFLEWSQGWSREYDRKQEERRERVYAHIQRARTSLRDGVENPRFG